ncbi:MaoC/PaaZ C-terminal domain-containing protein [Streptomyces viridosporus]|uniref:MaoC/PaaZ C-terminal domain-containing protein n=1 Tax=Streptomyces viridosporus TaxID=67581 RepID=UPI0009BD2699|nr:MaoC/PaaZ C-terminal domain-containing protein [Streptomyces viridosporus]
MTTTTDRNRTAPAAPAPRRAERTPDREETTAFRAAVRAALPGPAATADASPVHAFVLAHTLADATVRALAAGEPEPCSVVHLGQDIRTDRPVRPGETVTVTVDVLGARREARGTRLAVRSTLAAPDGTPFAELLTAALLVGATRIEPFGDIPPAAVAPAGDPGEPAGSRHELTADWIRGYAHASGDLNPIHLEERAARDAGFPTVLAHGMGVIALVCEEIADRWAGGDITRVRAVGARFSAPVLPGEPLDVAYRPDAAGRVVRFTCRVPGGTAVKGGWVLLEPAGHTPGGGDE